MPASLTAQIKQLHALLRKYRSKRPMIVAARATQRTQERQFLQGLLSPDGATEQNMAMHVGLDASSQAFHVLKSTLFRRLLNSMFLLDPRHSGLSEFGLAFYKNQKYVFLAKILAFFGARNSADHIAVKGLRISERYEFTSNALEFLAILQYSAVLHGNRRKFGLYRTKTKKWVGVLVAEIDIQNRFNEVNMVYAKRGSSHRSSHEKAFIGAIAAEQAFKQYQTFNLGLMYYRMKALSYQCQDNFRDCSEICLAAESYIRSRAEFNSDVRVAEFALKRLVCSVHLRDVASGLSAALLCRKIYPAGSYNWFMLMEYHFLLHTTSLQLDEALTIYEQVVSSSSYNDLDDFVRERWTLFRFYLMYANGTLKMNVKFKSHAKPLFKDFVRWIPSYRQDKAGYNTSVLILHIIFLLEKKDWRAVFERVDALRAYRLSHLAGKDAQADTFVQLILQLEPNNFERKRVEHACNALYADLQSAIRSDSVLIGVQVLPFEWLWQRILSSLK